ncbi:MAG: GGDEF domain-containing protein [Treponema sp.]|nr:GGDEF domain-containing protein [Treponema sp.]
MKKSFIIAYSIVASLALIGALTFFGVNLYSENQHGELRTQVRFEKLASAVFTTTQKTNISNNELVRQIENAVGDTKDFAYIKILSGTKQLYLFPSDYDENINNASELVIDYKKSNGTTSINAGLYSIRPGIIYHNALITFIIILIITLITIILIIYTNHFDKKNARYIKRPRPHYQIISSEEKTDEDTQEEVLSEDEEIVDEEEIQEVPEEPVEEAKTDAPAAPSKPAELPTMDYEPVELEGVESEKGLFSPDTGLGWESYLLTRLDNELNRATASELDLSLFVIKLNGIDRKNPLMKTICETLICEFQFKDLLFEYHEDCVCALKISMGIDDAVSFGEKLIVDINTAAGDEKPEVFIGISSRGIRMVSGDRLLKEADEAMVHAQEDANNPVVGFRADAIKYRKFIETK